MEPEFELVPASDANAVLSQSDLDNMNIPQEKTANKKYLEQWGGVEGLSVKLGIDIQRGLTHSQVEQMREKYGNNVFPESPSESFLSLLFTALSDFTLIVLMIAATVAIIIGTIEEPDHGFIDGVVIWIAVFLVSFIAAGNDYSKEKQFRALEATSQADEKCSVQRDGEVQRVNPSELVVGDIVVLQAGDQIPADCIICDKNVVLSNESSLTGEPDDMKKSIANDCFLLSACTITEAEESRALVIGIGPHSQWGRIKSNLVTETVNTPLQDKLNNMTELVGYVGAFSALATFITLTIKILIEGEDNVKYSKSFIDAIIICVTIIVVAIPEGLPLAVTIALAYSTSAMYKDQCFIRVLAACETMGNATNICSDKTGTLTENRMTVVEGWFANMKLSSNNFSSAEYHATVKNLLVEHISVNRTAYLIYKDQEGRPYHRPNIIGNKTEGALILMIRDWGANYETVFNEVMNPDKDKIFAFNSAKKRSTAVIHKDDGSVMIYCKGASEWILKDCTHFTDEDGSVKELTEAKRKELDDHILEMANNALRTLCLAHKKLQSTSELAEDWKENNPPDSFGLVLDCIVGIIDPLRGDVKDAVQTAQEAGVTVRMVTGDNIATASAIAKQCGILTSDGIAIEGPNFRKMTPADVDKILPKLQVMARSSPDDKYLLVTRLNGHGIPTDQQSWEDKYGNIEGVAFETHKDLILPGFIDEWEHSRPNGGDVVGVTGDGTNDAPALKAADVGMAMGITGTKVAQGAADIVILDDQFSSIIRAIRWGRGVYDAVRKFIQFQLTVNLAALVIVFIGAVVGQVPLNAVQLLWVNLVMDTMGALALATEPPTMELLQRRPYKRSASLISWPMGRNILVQFAFQLILILVLLFAGAQMFDVPEGIQCKDYDVSSNSDRWNAMTGAKDDNGTVQCSTFTTLCGNAKYGYECYTNDHTFEGNVISFKNFENFDDDCLNTCKHMDYRHNTLIFNAFIFAQIANEYNARELGNKLNCFEGLEKNTIFLMITIISIVLQLILVEFGDHFVGTSSLTPVQFLITAALGCISIPVGFLQRLIPVEEDPDSFFTSTILSDDPGFSVDEVSCDKVALQQEKK